MLLVEREQAYVCKREREREREGGGRECNIFPFLSVDHPDGSG